MKTFIPTVTLASQIIDTLNITIHSNVPAFFLGNPGLAKTSIVKRFCRENNFNYVGIRGADYSPEDITGFPVNKDNEELIRLKPDWFKLIEKGIAENKRSVLFIDELTTAMEGTQAALLEVIFGKMAGHYPLPEDTIIVAAGNYSGNLSTQFNLIAPIVNRFMVMNLKSDINLDLPLFLRGEENDTQNYKYIPSPINVIDPEEIADIFERYLLGKIEGFVDINDTEMGDIYLGKDLVYNIPTLRSIYYTKKIVETSLKIGLFHSPVLVTLINGLIGGNKNKNAKIKSDTIGEDLLKFMMAQQYIKTVLNQFDVTTMVSKDKESINFNNCEIFFNMKNHDTFNQNEILMTFRDMASACVNKSTKDQRYKDVKEKMKPMLDKLSKVLTGNDQLKAIASINDALNISI